jgi:hypothetical protein
MAAKVTLRIQLDPEVKKQLEEIVKGYKNGRKFFRACQDFIFEDSTG